MDLRKKIRMPSIGCIVARSYPQNIIGYKNALLWRLRTDMEFFKKSTTTHAVIMGRKTFESIGKPLSNRHNIIISREPGIDSGNVSWVRDRESALFIADYYSILNEKTQFFVVGGGEIYNMFDDLINKLYLTEVFSHFQNGDTYFNAKIDLRKWRIIEENDYAQSETDQYPFRISVFKLKNDYVRQRQISEFMFGIAEKRAWLNENFLAKIQKFESLPEEQFSLPLALA